jgi:ornithine carbamoyltransferase
MRGSIRGATVAWIGDTNNMCYTWLQAAELLGFRVHVSAPWDTVSTRKRGNAGCGGCTKGHYAISTIRDAARGADGSPPTCGPAWASNPERVPEGRRLPTA